ncbi:sugar phosphate isomerase/epimerase family protein [Planctomyces sp. SH-PL14]|uniref:sugar phosphate isomerase/epimerase family protein n=1 Tax=Planctomyces sp. SH-PL14 TaxID=1632864 RepID=UPI00078C0B36|nr:TIM barrel protein [Planctomyces sp. SH-PL14]AMV16670.1 Xylose isomerase-like TIM barrel [Planctomyces sp. SH-PL14]
MFQAPVPSSSRRAFLTAAAAGLAATALGRSGWTAEPARAIKFGLVTYMWGADWDLGTLLRNCEQTGLQAVELRTTHAHGVEPSLSAAERKEIRKRLADSPIECVGPGSNERFDDPNPEVVKKAIDASKAFLQLSHDIGTSGVKVKPDRFYPDVPREKTIEQIGRSLNELGKFAADLGQQVRLEVHGQCAELPTIAAIMQVADHPSVAVCWNSNMDDLKGEGLEANFALVRKRFGHTVHVRELDDPKYPFAKLLRLLVDTKYAGCVLLEAASKPADRIAALKEQRKLFDHGIASPGDL